MKRAAMQITQLVNEKDDLPANGGPWGEGDEPGAVSGRALQVRVAVMDGYGLHGDDAIDAIRAFRATLHGFVSPKSRGAFALPASVGRLIRALVRAAGLGRRARARQRGAGLMAAPPPGQGALSSAEGVVAGAPRRWLGLEGLVLLAGALIAFGALGQPWWLVPAGILAPDIAMSGYLAGTRFGAHLYNLAHATPLPAIMLGAGYWHADRLVMALALVWLAHIGLDRLLGIGLKYNDRFTHTHLGDRPDAR